MRRKVLSGKDSDRTAKYNLQNKNSEHLLIADICRRRETHPYSSADTGSKGQNKLHCGQGFGYVSIIVTYFQFLSTPPCRLPHCTSTSIYVPFDPSTVLRLTPPPETRASVLSAARIASSRPPPFLSQLSVCTLLPSAAVSDVFPKISLRGGCGHFSKTLLAVYTKT